MYIYIYIFFHILESVTISQLMKEITESECLVDLAKIIY